MPTPYARLVRWAFDRLYRELAWSYDAVAAAVSWGRWRGWALAALPLLGGDILELGCGTGNLQRAMADQAPSMRAVGLDLSRQMLGLARRKAPGARLVRADSRALPFAGGSFDWVVATFPTEYIADARTLREAARALRPGGRLAVVLGAQLEGPALYRAAVGQAYRATLQRPPARESAVDGYGGRLGGALAAAGLVGEGGWRDAPGGSVFVIVARRAAEGAGDAADGR